MKIEKGKFYRTRGGKKVEVLTNERNHKQSIVIMDEYGNIDSRYRNGTYLNDKSETTYDLVSEWTNPVEIPWIDYPTWCKWVAMDKDGRWFNFTDKPIISNIYWIGDGACFIPTDYTPSNFTGDWTESLFERPCE
jgi:hypothetical protein